jgi:threonine synthase
MACAGAAAGLEVVLFVPESAPRAKLLQSVLYGAMVVPIQGTYDDAFALSVEYTKIRGGINRNTAYNPLTVEGKKTAAIEIYNQLGRRAPGTVYIPAGDGVIFSGVYKGFADLKQAGYIETLPMLVLVQAEGSNAISRFLSPDAAAVPVSPHTVADSLSVASPASAELALKALAETCGRAVEVSDGDILAAQHDLCAQSGTFVEPAAAAAWAGYLADRENIDPNSETVILLTGTGFKDMDTAASRIQTPASCGAEIDSVVRYLSETYGVKG